MQSADLFYYAGTAQNGNMLIHSHSQPRLLIRKYYPRAVSETPWSDVDHIANLKEFFTQVSQYFKSKEIRTVGLEFDVVPVSLYQKIRNYLDLDFVDISMEIRRQRMIKSDWEQGLTRAAAGLLDDIFEQMSGWLEPGMTELKLAGLIESRMRQQGHQGILPIRGFNGAVHYGNILFGKNGAIRGPFDGPTCGSGLYPAHPKGAGTTKLEPEQPVFVDLVAGVGGYMADATRIFSLGSLPEVVRQNHSHCLNIQAAVLEGIRLGQTCSELYQTARNLAMKSGIADIFMGPKDDQVSFIAHGIGLEVDELPVFAPGFDFRPPVGSIFALEPKAVDVNLGAVGIENTFLLSESGPENLIHFPEIITEVPY